MTTQEDEMGLFGGMKDARDAMKAAPDLMKQAQEMQQQAMAGQGGPAGAMAEAQALQKINAAGVNKQATLQAMTPTGELNPGGGEKHAITVDVLSDDGAGSAYTATFHQYLMPAQLEQMQVGQQITVRIDPDDMNSMLFWGPAA